MSLLSKLSERIFQFHTALTLKYVRRNLIKPHTQFVPCFNMSTERHGQNQEIPTTTVVEEKFQSFEAMIENRRKEAQRSIIVQVHSEHSCSELHNYCSKFGIVKGLHHYVLQGSSHFCLVEFASEVDARNLLNECTHAIENQVIPVCSPFLWFRASDKKNVHKVTTHSASIIEVNSNMEPPKDYLHSWMMEAQSLTDQILILYHSTRLEDLGSRLRFLTAYQIELALSGTFPFVQAVPFGSSVNGFGRLNCDLDLVLHLNKKKKDDTDIRLVFHAKTALANGRTQAQRHMDTIGDICQFFLPGCSNIRRILHARVPIIKYKQELTGVDCDLSMSNMSAIHMSELLYLFGTIDPRVKPLVYVIRYWAREVGLTNPIPGRWITNFSLTLLVLFFLQQTKPSPLLPTVNTLIALTEPQDHRVTSDGVNCTFVRDIFKLKKHMTNQQANPINLQDLLLNFFEFYSGFDFHMRGISLANGISIPKPEYSALYIANPLEQGLNVSRNVSSEEVEHLRMELRNAAWTLESAAEPSRSAELWGLLAIFKSQFTNRRHSFYFPSTPNRLMDVSELFDEAEDVPVQSPMKIDSVKIVQKPFDDRAGKTKRTQMKTATRKR